MIDLGDQSASFCEVQAGEITVGFYMESYAYSLSRDEAKAIAADLLEWANSPEEQQ